MPLRPCLDCGRPSPGSRCPAHEAQRERNRKQRPTNLSRDSAEQQRRADVVAAHRAVHGDWCPGWADRSAHVVVVPNILTADHDVAVAVGGDPHGPLTVRCRVCNGAKADR